MLTVFVKDKAEIEVPGLARPRSYLLLVCLALLVKGYEMAAAGQSVVGDYWLIEH